MRVLAITLVLLGVFGVAHAALPPFSGGGDACNRPITSPSQIYNIQGKTITYYVPHNSPGCERSIEGCVATSCRGLDAQRSRLPTCLDAVRLGKAKYVTLASDKSQTGKYFHIGTVTYRSALDMQMYTVKDVIGYVHDTGGAFRGRPDKLDVCTTVCATCTDAQAGALAQGKNVSLTRSGEGVLDPNNQPSANPNLGAYSSYGNATVGSPGAFTGTGGAAAGYGAAGVAPGFANQGQTSVSSQLGQTPEAGGAGRFAATLLVQPKSARQAQMVLVSWSSIGMKEKSCTVREQGKDPIRQQNDGSDLVRLPLVAQGSVTYELTCTPLGSMSEIARTASVSIVSR